MPLTESKRRANNKYIAAHYTILACKVRKDYAEEIKKKAESRGETVNAIIKRALDDYMDN